MPHDRPFALHIIWTTYGTWLPGDERGHVSNTLIPHDGYLAKQNTPGTHYAAGDDYTRTKARELMKGEPVWLNSLLAQIAAQSLAQAATKRDWRIARAAIMANHIHVVIMNCPDNGPQVRRILKGVSQAALNDFVGKNQRWYTAGGSDRYKHDWPAIDNAINYVAKQERKLAEIIDNVVHMVGSPTG